MTLHVSGVTTWRVRWFLFCAPCFFDVSSRGAEHGHIARRLGRRRYGGKPRTAAVPSDAARHQHHATHRPLPGSSPLPDMPYISNALGAISGGSAIFSEQTLLAAVAHWTAMAPNLASLPFVDVGTNTGVDMTIPAAKLGHRVYAYEPTPSVINTMKRYMDAQNVSWTREARGFASAPNGTVLVRNVAVSDRVGKAEFTLTGLYNGVANTLGGKAALPKLYLDKGTKIVRVPIVRLSDELEQETQGVYLLKIDSQGHEEHVLRGIVDYARRYPVYIVLLEFTPMLLRASGTEPLQLLRLLSDELRMQCFEARNRPRQRSMSLEAFAAMHDSAKVSSKFGSSTDLMCVRLDLLRRRRR